MRAAVRLVAFDLDDTLWSTGAVIGRATQKWYTKLGQLAPKVTEKYSLEELSALRETVCAEQPDLKANLTAVRLEITRAACKSTGEDPGVAEEAFEEFARWRSEVDDHLFPEVLEVLYQLRRHVRMCGITNGNSDVSLTAAGPYMEFCIRSMDVGQAKPSLVPFAAALEAAGVTAAETVMVGDNSRDDIAGGAEAGMRTVWINRKARPWPEGTKTSTGATVQPDSTLDSLLRLPELITTWQAQQAPPGKL